MCFNSGSSNSGAVQPPLPPPAKPIMPVAAPQAPPTISQAPSPIQTSSQEPTIKSKRSKRDQQNLLSRGTSSLRIPLNGSGGEGGGLNV